MRRYGKPLASWSTTWITSDQMVDGAGKITYFSVMGCPVLDSAMADLQQKVFYAARDGMAITIYAMLCNRKRGEVERILRATTSSDGHDCTPLMIAAKNGHEKVCRVLLSQFRVNTETAGTVRLDGAVVRGATALWCAAGAGHFDVVRTLVKFGADINHPTLSNSTPLRASCYEGRLDIVKFLIANGADMKLANKYNNTCLMIACYRGHCDVVNYLLEQGINPDAKAHCGSSALHFSAECGHFHIVKDLVKFNASMLKNNYGVTPLLGAAECGQAEIVEFFLNTVPCSKEDRIHALELLGASYANDKHLYDVDKAYRYMWLAMHERYSDPCDILKKQVAPPVQAYGNRVESQTVTELESLQDNAHAIHIEALIVRERILGDAHPEIPQPIIFRGAVLADESKFHECTVLWLHALQLRRKCNRTVTKDLQRFAEVFSQMLQVNTEIKFSLVFQILEYTLQELHHNFTKMQEFSLDERGAYQEILENNINTALYLMVIALKVQKLGSQELQLCKLVYKFVQLNLRLQNGYTLLHAAVDGDMFVDEFHVADVVKFPNTALAKLLIKCGADLDAYDNNLNTPLHIIVQYNKPISDFVTLHGIIMTLLESGAHVDLANKDFKTPMDVATTGVAEIILRLQRNVSLKCLASKAVRKYGLTYKGQVPASLEEFIRQH